MLRAAELGVDVRPAELDVDAAGSMIKLLEMLEDLDDVQDVYSNADISEAILEQL